MDNFEFKILGKLERYFRLEGHKKELLEEIIYQYFHKETKTNSANASEALKESLDEILRILGHTFQSPSVAMLGNPMIIANHIGFGKLFKINLKVINPSFERLVNDDPFHFLILGAYLICKRHNLNLHCLFTEFKYPVCNLLEGLGFIQIDRDTSYSYSKLKSKIQSTIELDKNAAICVFPEGGTTGKRNTKGIYSLERFRPGFMNLANDLSLKIISSCQVLNREGHLVIKYTGMEQIDYQLSMQKNIDSILNENNFNKWI